MNNLGVNDSGMNDSGINNFCINDFGKKIESGFTLIEVMVALIIFAVLSVTLLTRLGDNIRAERYLQDKTLAALVAENTLAELRSKRDWSAVSTKSDTREMANIQWNIKINVTDTPNENLKRVDVSVGPKLDYSSEESSIVTLTSFLGRY
jgi:general secretion pathway protein I